MKKLFLVLAVVSFVSSIPSYALKIIVNDNSDRIVYSRSTSPAEAISEYDNNSVETNYTYTNYVKSKQISTDKLKYIGNAIKPEFVGVKWDFSVQEEPKKPRLITKNIDKYTLAKYNRNSREASDYYTQNQEKDPKALIPSWEDDI